MDSKLPKNRLGPSRSRPIRKSKTTGPPSRLYCQILPGQIKLLRSNRDEWERFFSRVQSATVTQRTAVVSWGVPVRAAARRFPSARFTPDVIVASIHWGGIGTTASAPRRSAPIRRDFLCRRAPDFDRDVNFSAQNTTGSFHQFFTALVFRVL
jgi:hypothetical protein